MFINIEGFFERNFIMDTDAKLKNKKTRIGVSVSVADRDAASKLFKDLGMDTTTAINLFLKQSIAEQALPFRPQVQPTPQLNATTLQAVQEATSSLGETFTDYEDWKQKNETIFGSK